MVLTNTSPNSLNGDFHPIPAVHVDEVARAAILAYIAAAGTGGHGARSSRSTAAEFAAAPQVPEIAEFSSRGPSTTTEGDILKPDIAAPGVDVVAAVAPPFNHGRIWDFMSGTSMASPHIAGIGALLKAAHPAWLPSEIKSAMMTSATDTVSSANDPFAQGAGFVNPNGAADPGLVYPTTADEYRQYLVSLGAVFSPPYDTLEPISASNLNQASISIGKLAGVETVTRRVRNVGATQAIYVATASVPGFRTVVTPEDSQAGTGGGEDVHCDVHSYHRPARRLGHRFAHLEERSAQRTQPDRAGASCGQRTRRGPWRGCQWLRGLPGHAWLHRNAEHHVARPRRCDSDGGEVATGPFDPADPVADADTDLYSVAVPAGTVLARFSVNATSDADDLDLFVYLDDELVDLSATGAADEEVTIVAPAEGTYEVYVNGFSASSGGAYTISNFVVGDADLPNSSVTTGVPVTVGVPVTLTASWTGLDPAQRWLGLITYEGADAVTVFSVG